jgi:hypothetical protein
MFSQKTVLILGAGASWHYGYPTGEGLIRRIVDQTRHIDSATLNGLLYHHKLCQSGRYKMNDSEALSNALMQQQPLSIDAFLACHPSLQVVGKVLIAYCLRQCEIKKAGDNITRTKDDLEHSLENGHQQNWYKFLVDAMISRCSTTEQFINSINNLNIITFNYDMSLEYYLYSRLSKIESFQSGRTEILEFLQQRIHHVYGQLYDCTKEHLDTYGTLSSSKENQHYFLGIALNSSENIFVITDERAQRERDQYRTMLQGAAKVCILGYGFLPENNALLGLDWIAHPEVEVCYTNKDNSQRISNVVNRFKLLGKYPNRFNGEYYPDDPLFSEKTNVQVSTGDCYRALSMDFDLT